MGALVQAVRSGKALYVGLSNYPADLTARAASILRESGLPPLIHQPSYSILERWVEPDLLGMLDREGIGCIAFCPLAQGLLTGRYLEGIPEDSRAAKPHGFLKSGSITPALLATLRALNGIAAERGQTLAQMALAWVLRRPEVTSALIGASRVEQIEENLATLRNLHFSEGELREIETLTASS